MLIELLVDSLDGTASTVLLLSYCPSLFFSRQKVSGKDENEEFDTDEEPPEHWLNTR